MNESKLPGGMRLLFASGAILLVEEARSIGRDRSEAVSLI